MTEARLVEIEDKWFDEFDDCDDMDEVIAEVRRLREALEAYGRHSYGCSAYQWEFQPPHSEICTCGLVKALSS